MSTSLLLTTSVITSLGLTLFGVGTRQQIQRLSYALPIVGLVRFVVISQIISVTTNARLLSSAAFSCALLTFYSLYRIKYLDKNLALIILKSWAILSLASITVLLIRQLGNSPFGTYNFDFVYGIQDGMYLETNSVRLPDAQGGSFPFNWGSVEIGRYCGIFLVTLLTSLLEYPLVAGAIAYAVFIGLIFASYIFFCQRLLGLNSAKSIFLGILVSVSPLNLLGFQNQLIGQTSGIPIAVLLIGLLFHHAKWSEFRDREFQIDVGFLVAGLFWIYPAQMLLLGPLFLLVVVIMLLQSSDRGAKRLLLQGIGITVTIFALSVSKDLSGTLGRIESLIFYSEGEQNSSGSILYNSIFNQFSSARGPTIASGLRVYGDNLNTWPLLLLYVSFIIGLVSFVSYRLISVELKQRSLGQSSVTVFFLLYIFGSFVVFFVTKQNYLLFKLATWFTPLTLLFLLILFSSFWQHWARSSRLRVSTVLIPFLLLNFSTSQTIAARALQGDAIPFVNSKFALDRGLNQQMSSTERPTYIYMPSMEEAAWITINIPERIAREKVEFFGFDQQSLFTGFNRSLPTFPKIRPDSIVFLPVTNNDIFPDPKFLEDDIWNNGDIQKVEVDSIQRLFTFGIGTFYPDRAEQSPFGNKIPFRWSNGYLSFGVYVNSPETLGIKIPVLLGPDFSGQFIPEVNNGEVEVSPRSDGRFEVSWTKITLVPGWNTLEMNTTQNQIKGVDRDSLRPDFRPLAIALGRMEILYE